MRMLVIFNIFIIFAEGSRSDKTIANFVRNYYANRDISQVVFFGCWDPNDYVKFSRNLMQLDTRIVVTDIRDNIDMERLLKVNYYKIGIVLDYDCPRSDIVFEEFSKNRLPFNESYHWLVLTETKTIPTDVLRRLPLRIDTEMTFAQRQLDSYDLHDVYNPSYRHDGHLNVTFKGVWTHQNGLRDELTQYKYIRRGNLHGLRLNFSYVLLNPALPNFETYMTTPINRHLDTMIRSHYALVLQLRNIYNFTINLKRAETWGYLVNGTWNGILADMIDGLTDVSVAPLQYKAERMDVCEFTVETYLGRPCLIFRHPKKNDLRNPFLKPFIRNVWYFIAGVGTICYVTLFLTTKMEKKVPNGAKTNNLDSSVISEIGLITVAAISQQGSSGGPQSISGRIVLVSLFLWGVLLYQFYSASIVGSLLSEPPRYIKSVDDLRESSIDVNFEDVAYHYDYFQTSTDPSVHAFYDKKIKPTKKRPKGSFENATYGLSLVKKGGTALHIDTATAYKIIADTFTEDEICDLQEIEMMGSKKLSIVTAKKSPFTKMFIYGLRRIVQHGIADAMRKIWLVPRPTCPDGRNSKPVPVRVEEFSPAIFLLLTGSTVAILIMILENTYNNIFVKYSDESTRQSTPKNEAESLEPSTKNSGKFMNLEDVS